MSEYNTPEKRAAHAARQRAWRAANPDRWAEIAARARRRWKQANRDQHRECQRANRYALRREILQLLGGEECAICGWNFDWRGLEIDHVNSDGKFDRENVKAKWAFRKGLLDGTIDKSRYQVLCACCNRIKAYDAGEHPWLHRKEQSQPVEA